MLKITFYFGTTWDEDGFRFTANHIKDGIARVREEACQLFHTCSTVESASTRFIKGKYRTENGYILFTVVPCETGMEEQYRGDIDKLCDLIKISFPGRVATTIEDVN